AMHFNTAIAKLIELVNDLTRLDRARREAIEPLLLMVAPLAPHLAEELWSHLAHEQSLSRAPYPVDDPALVKADTVTCVVQVRGMVRHRVQVDPDIAEAALDELELAEPRVQAVREGLTVRKVIVRAPKLVNIVV